MAGEERLYCHHAIFTPTRLRWSHGNTGHRGVWRWSTSAYSEGMALAFRCTCHYSGGRSASTPASPAPNTARDGAGRPDDTPGYRGAQVRPREEAGHITQITRAPDHGNGCHDGASRNAGCDSG